MEALIRKSNGVRLCKIDVPTWESPVARANSIRVLPTLWLYDGDRLVSRDTGQVMSKLMGRAKE